MSTPRDALVRYWTEVNAYKDKEPEPVDLPDGLRLDDRDEGKKAIVVTYLWGDRVRLKDATEGEVGRVVLVEAGPCGVRYEVSWPDSREFSQHYDFELEDADS